MPQELRDSANLNPAADKAAGKALEVARRMQSEFLAKLSHELRTPLNAIIGFSEALKDGLIGHLSKTQHEYISDIFNSGHHLLALIDDILDLAKVEAGMMALKQQPVDLKCLLPNSVSIVKENAEARTGERIALVVEDDDLGADLLRLLLQAEGFTVLRAASAEAALLLAPQQAISLITLDLQLPGIGGLEFLDQIRKDSTQARVPVVIIAGLNYSNMVLTGAAAVLQKPISRAQLKTTLANLGLLPAEHSAHAGPVAVEHPKQSNSQPH